MPRTKTRQVPIKSKLPQPRGQGDQSTLDAWIGSNKKPGDILLHIETGISTVQRVVTRLELEQAQSLITSAGHCLEAQRIAIYEAIQVIYKFPPREGQQEALHHLIYHRQDLILIAKTAFGKSMILQAISLLLDKTISIVILPLDQIGKEQAEKIAHLGGQPCFLNADTISNRFLTDVRNAKYTHLLMSPELAVSDRLRKTILDPKFKDELALVVVDEAHLVQLWGIKFRTDYARLNLLRSLLGCKIPWYCCSATLDSSALDGLIKGIGLDANIKIQRTSIDRPELLYQIGIIPSRSRRKYSALRFLFDSELLSDDQSKVDPCQIPKTIVFFDSKREAYSACDSLQDYLQKHERHQYTVMQSKEMIHVFTQDTHDKDKQHTISELQKEGTLSAIRVVFATEALGLGVDLPDIRQVVQYGIPRSLYAAVFLQRGRRAGRDGNDGSIILLVDKWVVGECALLPWRKQGTLDEEEMEDILQESDDEDATSCPHMEQSQTTIKMAKQRARLPDFWHQLCNQESHCIWSQILDYFSEPKEYQCQIRKERCCSNCNQQYHIGSLDDSKYYLYHEIGSRYTKAHREVAKDIQSWASKQVDTIYHDIVVPRDAYCFLSTSQQAQLAREARQTFNLQHLRDILKSWKYLDTHGEALLSVLRDSCRRHILKSSQTSTNNSSQSQPIVLDSQATDIVSTQLTSSMCPPQAISDTPSRPTAQSGSLYLETPSQDMPLTPVPDLTMSAQSVLSTTSAEPATPATPLVPRNSRKRQPLGIISGNRGSKRARPSKAEMPSTTRT